MFVKRFIDFIDIVFKLSKARFDFSLSFSPACLIRLQKRGNRAVDAKRSWRQGV